MARLTLTINDDLDRRFREAVSRTLGFKKGNLQVAIEEALNAWIKKRG